MGTVFIFLPTINSNLWKKSSIPKTITRVISRGNEEIRVVSVMGESGPASPGAARDVEEANDCVGDSRDSYFSENQRNIKGMYFILIWDGISGHHICKLE